jgi:hypothetical protein
LVVWRRVTGELFTLTDLRQLDLQTLVYAPVPARTLPNVRTSVENWETHLRKFGEVGGHMPDKQTRNILLKLLPKEVADPLIMHLQDYPTFNILKQHALHTVDMLSKFHKDVKTTNLLQAEESDDDWNDEESECSPCNDDEGNNPLNQIMAMLKKKFGGASSGMRPILENLAASIAATSGTTSQTAPSLRSRKMNVFASSAASLGASPPSAKALRRPPGRYPPEYLSRNVLLSTRKR